MIATALRVFAGAAFAVLSILVNLLVSTAAHADFIAGPTLPSPRADASATLLANGRIFIVGGFISSGSPLPQTGSTLIFDPVANTYTNGATIGNGGRGRAGVRLADGRVLLNGGGGGIQSLQSSTIYNPTTNSFTSAPDSTAAMFYRRAVLLADGRALFYGGGAQGEIYNPATNSWIALGASLEFQRAGYAVVEVSPGKLLLAGDSSLSDSSGTSPNIGRATPAYLYDTATNVLTSLPPAFLSEGGTTPMKDIAVLKLVDGRILFTGGQRRDFRPGAANVLGQPNPKTSIFDPQTTSFSEINVAPPLTNVIRLFAQGSSVWVISKIDPRAAAGSSILTLDSFSLATLAWTRIGSFDLQHDGSTSGLEEIVQLQNGDLFIPGGHTNSGASITVSDETWLVRASSAFPPQSVSRVSVTSPNTANRIISAAAGQATPPITARLLDIADLPVPGQRVTASTDVANRATCTEGTLSNSNGESFISCVAGTVVANGNALRVRSGAITSADIITLNVTVAVTTPLASNPPTAAQQVSIVAGNGLLGGGVVNDVAPASVPVDTSNVSQDLEGNTYFTNANGLIYAISALTGRIFTVGGTGVAGFSGDGGAASRAQFNNPTSLIFDADGNLYIADAGNNRIRRIAFGTLIVTTLAGGGALTGDNILGTNALLNAPRGLSLDGFGYLYFIDSGNRVMRLHLVTGILSVFAGSQTAGSTGDNGTALNARFNSITAIRFDLQGNLFLLDAGNFRIRCINRSGIVLAFAGNGLVGFAGDGGSAVNAQFTSLRDLAFDLFGQLYVLDNGMIRRINLHTGVISLYLVAGLDNANPWGIYVDRLGNLILAERNRLRTVRYAANPIYALQFPSILASALDTLVLSGQFSLGGFSGSVTLSIDGGEYNIGCLATAPWSSALQQITISNPAQQVCLRVRAGNFAGATRTAVFKVNNSGSPFTVVSPEPDLVPRYRVFVSALFRHLYTTDKNEYDYITTNFPGTYTAEGISHFLYRATDAAGASITILRAGQTATPYYRLYFKAQQRHFYTSDFNEYDSLRKVAGLAEDEKISGSLFLRYGVPGTVPLYRMYNPAINSHLWTVDTNEFTVLKTRGWVAEGRVGNPEGVDGYVYSR